LLKNNYLYQGAYAELDEDIGWNDFALRNYDAQIGRWVQQDPYQEFASPYVGMGNDPVNLVDPSGGSILSGLTKAGTVAVFTIGGAIIGTAIDLISGGDGFKGTAIGAGIGGLAAGFGFLIEKITVGMGIQTANIAVSLINTKMTTGQAGKQADNRYLGTDKNLNGQGELQQIQSFKVIDTKTKKILGILYLAYQKVREDKVVFVGSKRKDGTYGKL
jgi:RHS repeat-associated protein